MFKTITSEIQTMKDIQSKSTKTYLNILFMVMFIMFFSFGYFASKISKDYKPEEE